MPKSPYEQPNPAEWMEIATRGWMMWLDMANVIWLRSAMMVMGGAPAEREMLRMVSEKLAANSDFVGKLALGHAGSSPEAVTRAMLGHYGPRVAANRKRLSRPTKRRSS